MSQVIVETRGLNPDILGGRGAATHPAPFSLLPPISSSASIDQTEGRSPLSQSRHSGEEGTE